MQTAVARRSSTRLRQQGDCGYHILSIEDAERDADVDPKVIQMRSTFEAIGRHCATLDKTANSIGDLVRQLMKKGIRLKDRTSCSLAMTYMQV